VVSPVEIEPEAGGNINSQSQARFGVTEEIFAAPGSTVTAKAGFLLGVIMPRTPQKPIHIPAGLDGVLSRLDKLKVVNSHNWVARCPAHDDKTPSLSIKSTNGKVLLYCHTGCSTRDIVGALGLELRDLFEKPLPLGARRDLAVRATRRETETAINHECLILAQTLGNRVCDRTIDPLKHQEREIQAARRIIWLLPRLYGEAISHG